MFSSLRGNRSSQFWLALSPMRASLLKLDLAFLRPLISFVAAMVRIGSVSTDGSDASPVGSPDRASFEIQRQPSDDDIPLLPCSLLCPREFISSHLLFVGSTIFPAALHPSAHRTGLAQRDF